MKKIPLSSAGCGKADVDLGSVGFFTFVTRYNYTASCWAMDILDSVGFPLANGVMLVPGVSLLHAYPAVEELLGVFYLQETSIGQYLLPDSLGRTTYLTWTSPDELGGVTS